MTNFLTCNNNRLLNNYYSLKIRTKLLFLLHIITKGNIIICFLRELQRIVFVIVLIQITAADTAPDLFLAIQIVTISI